MCDQLFWSADSNMLKIQPVLIDLVWSMQDTIKCSLNEAKILDKEDQIQEENQGGHQNPPREAWTEQGLYTGLDIPAVILQRMSHDPEGSCDTNGH